MKIKDSNVGLIMTPINDVNKAVVSWNQYKKDLEELSLEYEKLYAETQILKKRYKKHKWRKHLL